MNDAKLGFRVSDNPAPGCSNRLFERPFTFISKQSAIAFFHQIDFLLVIRTPEIHIRWNGCIGTILQALDHDEIFPQLTDIIALASGFTENASFDEASIIRRSSTTIQDLEYERLRRMVAADMTPQEYDLFKSLSRSRPGEISIDFVKLFKGKDLSNDIFLVNRDVITIPAMRDLVRVTGAVQQPGYIKWEKNADTNFYIGKAGGFNFNADAGKARIIKAKTGQYFKLSKKILLEAGDTIHIPETKPFDTWGAVKDAAAVFANAATIIIMAKQLKNF